MSCVRPAVRPSVLHGKNLSFGHYKQALEPILFIPAMLVGTIYFYHFLPLLLTLILAGGHKVSAEQNLFKSWLHFLTHFSSN